MNITNVINEFNETHELQSKYHVNAMWFKKYDSKLKRLFSELKDLTSVELLERDSSDKTDSFAESYEYIINNTHKLVITTSRNRKTTFYDKIKSA